jgi:nucleotide-binding universal stress UspA family protein
VTNLAGVPSDASVPANVLEALDDSKVTGVQWKIMLVSGMGFFTDAYDLFVIGIVVVLLTPEWHLSTSQVSLLNSATLAASAVGAIVFGRVADMIGRKKIYGFEVLILPVVAEGDPTEVLIQAAAEADLLVLGSRGRSPFKGLLLGSVTQGCAAGAACPVVIVKDRPEIL